MATKVKAASIATQGGVEMIIASGQNPSLMLDLIHNRGEGTFFRTGNGGKTMERRKLWLSATTLPAGKLVVDAGAHKALVERGSSLLPSGIKDVQGDFLRGSVVEIVNEEGKVIGKGIVRYNSNECMLIQGCQSHEIESKLGFSNGVAVHRNDLVLS